ncbi:glycosyltransferase family 4 protein [Pallidibacillus thermolactis]|jgi:L-malate glycosyltransferase|uniref:glycosyltransferase family 4 protein n=1 Tax=Pallidibacillus thermolactis TaxID=251051 RepID=UPI0021DB76ED|nr:glycosyltransferase family 4 protein [Pallidibacillus thermolactis]MCU9599709.1 glycosyltransferase family 4 protein [Pallidibacillus thermolactis subsp. kokeshiiformis]
MKVCFFAHSSKTYKNGAALSLINIANEMADRGIEVIIILPNKNIQYPITNRRVKCITIPALSMRTRIDDFSITNKLKEKIKKIYNWFSKQKAISILKKEKPNIIHINGLDTSVGAEAAISLDIPYVWHIRQLLEEDFGMRLHDKSKIYKLLNRANSVIAISKTVKEKFEKILNIDLTIIYNGIPLENYMISEKNSFSANTVNILLAGRILEQKGQLDAVKAMNHLVKTGTKNIFLTIAGQVEDNGYANRIKEYIIEHRLNGYIEIIDHINDLRQLRKKCDIGLICSKKEAFGRVTIETMVSRMLVIGANTGGTLEIIKDNENGLLYHEGDYLSLANKIKYAIENKNEMKSIIDRGYKSALENYSISKVVDQIIDIYDSIQK